MPTRPASHTAQRHRAHTATPRKTSRRLYDSKRWRHLSLSYLQSHPLCASCQALGRTTPAQCVDHIRAHRGDPILFWDETNWQALCHECHGLKTSQETRGGRRGPPTLPGLSAARVAVVAGPPGQQRNQACLDWIAQSKGVALDPWDIAGQWEAGEGDIRRAHAIQHAELERLARDGFDGRIAIALSEPSAIGRRAWAAGVGAACRVVVGQGDGQEEDGGGVEVGAWAGEVGRWKRWLVIDADEVSEMQMRTIIMRDTPGDGGS